MPFSPDVYHGRREALLKRLGDGVIVIPTSPEYHRNGDVYFPHRPDSYFYYLTGFSEPEAWLVIVSGKKPKSILFCREKELAKEMWFGRRLGPYDAKKLFGLDEACPISILDEGMPELLGGHDAYCSFGADDAPAERVKFWMRRVRAYTRNPFSVKDARPQLDEMRLIKSTEEIAVMRHAAQISAEGHVRAMRACKPGMREYELEAVLTAHFRKSGGSALHAYPPVVAGGNNACILHYVENNQVLKNGDLVLVDAGAELDCYASDITRTFPVNGRFTAEQRAIYEIVLEAELAAIEKARWGSHVPLMHNSAAHVVARGLVRLGILRGYPDDLVSNGLYKRFFMHNIGHWLGLDVHDVGDYYAADGLHRELVPGMVLTVEPGIYIPMGSQGVSRKWWGIGVRIEDDVLVTDGAPEVLSASAPKSVADIESLMK